MIRRGLCAAGLLAGLSGCVPPPVPDDSAVDYFNQSARVERDVLLTGVEPVDPDTGAPADAATAAAAEPDLSAAGSLSNPGISLEQDFDAVANVRSIELDKQRIDANRELYVLIEPTALPRRPGTNTPNIVAFALQTNNPVGARLYPRSRLRSDRAHQSACAKYPSPDKAQTAFLSAGGPTRDRRNLDPDGDGFACSWDPTPFRKARATLNASASGSAASQSGTATASATSTGTQPAAPSAVVEPLVISSE